jgi:hypothetical protein
MKWSSMMTQIRSALATIICIVSIATADESCGQFQGEWRTTISPLKLKQNGDTVSGTYGRGGQFPLKGIVKGNILTFEYTEGQAKGDGRFALDAMGNAFMGCFQIRNGQGGYWNG